MRMAKYFIMLVLLGTSLAVAAPASHAQVAIGVGPAYAAGPPACAYGYYGYYPYACAPYGYYGPSYFNGGIFIGAGPWFGWCLGGYCGGRGYYCGHGYGYGGRGAVGGSCFRGGAGGGFH